MKLIWYPKCSTCIKAKKYIEDKGYVFELQDIKQDPPSKMELQSYIKKSGKDIKKFFNTSGMKYRELDLKNKIKTMTENDMLDLLSSDGMLIKRPILVYDDNVLIGFREKEWENL